MVKKNRIKRRRKHANILANIKLLCSDIPGLPNDPEFVLKQEKQFRKCVRALRTLFSKYRRVDVAIALNISDLWLHNAASPIKHVFAWCVLLNLESASRPGRPIRNYSEFKRFAEKLYKIWPQLPALEDFSPEADWGHIKVRLAEDFVPMFYGSCIERTPDFVEAFRITFAHVPEALAQMDLAIALQEQIIETMSDFKTNPVPKPQVGYIEVPAEGFWDICRKTLLQLGLELADWRSNTDESLQANFGDFNLPQTWSRLSLALRQGTALPFLAVERGETWVPISIRSAPSVVIDYWGGKGSREVSIDTHRELARFAAERFHGTLRGPFTLFIGERACKDVAISCVISSCSDLYLICASSQYSCQQTAKVAKNVTYRLSHNESYALHCIDEKNLQLRASSAGRFGADDIHFIIVNTQASTASRFVTLPETPARFFPMADFVTIFDSLDSLSELNRYWKFVDTHRHLLTNSSTGPVDLFAVFRDNDEIIIGGAISPNAIQLEPFWGTSWRFKALEAFWKIAPKVFPDGSSGWSLSEEAEGIVSLKSRHRPADASSTTVGDCTVQALIEIKGDWWRDDVQMLDLFAQLVIDYINQYQKLLSDCLLFQQPHLL